MHIRETTSVSALTKEERQILTIASIEELDDMYRRGDIEQAAYIMKKRALLRLL